MDDLQTQTEKAFRQLWREIELKKLRVPLDDHEKLATLNGIMVLAIAQKDDPAEERLETIQGFLQEIEAL